MSELVTQHNISQVRQTAVAKLRGEPLAAPAPADAPLTELNEQSRHLQELLEKLEALAEPQARALAQESLQALLALYGGGLARILQILDAAGPAAESVTQALLDDSVVRGLLMIHGLYPVDLETRLQEALGKVRPYLESHGGNVEVTSLRDGVAHLRLKGTCHGCPSSAVTLELAIKDAITEACPDLVDLQVEGVVAGPPPKNPVSPNGPRWTPLNGFGPPGEGESKSLELAGVPLVVCRTHGNLYAYRNECPACGLALEIGPLEEGFLRCRLGHRFDARLAGRCPDNEDVHLEPLPLLAQGEVIKVSVR
jgi:Fe-S cluster biogenesis protein NfuA/nitrite reductase/ring-hydroxylating ferredoxin subunit